jgi:hypothetical protein
MRWHIPVMALQTIMIIPYTSVMKMQMDSQIFVPSLLIKDGVITTQTMALAKV